MKTLRHAARRGIMVGCAAALAVASGPGAASAEQDLPKRAKTIRAALVRAYAPCTAPNDFQPVVGSDACTPAATISDPALNGGCEFGPDGHGEVILQAAGSRANPKMVLRVRMSGVRCGSPATPATGTALIAQAVMRYTSSRTCTSGADCTVESILGGPIACGSLAGLAPGRCEGAQVYEPNLSGVRVPPDSEGSIEFSAIAVGDPTGRPFAVPGIRFR